MQRESRNQIVEKPAGVWEKHLMALDDVTDRLRRITTAFSRDSVPFALVGGQAVAMWVASKDPAAVRTTKDVDILLNRADLSAARAAAMSADMDYFEVMGVGMFLDRTDPNPRRAVHLVWAGEKVRPEYPLPAPSVDSQVEMDPGICVVPLIELVIMKLMPNRDQDRVHLRDMIEVGLVDRSMSAGLPQELAVRLEELLAEAGL